MSHSTVAPLTVGFRFQREWGWLIALAFFIVGTGAGLFLVSLLAEFQLGMVLGIAIAALGGSPILIVDLGQPKNFWRVLMKPGSSWLSRGTIFLVVFTGAGLLYVVPSYSAFAWLPWEQGSALGTVLAVIASVAAFGAAIYSGLEMSSFRAIPLWNTPLLPVLFVLLAGLGATGVIFAMWPGLDSPPADMQVFSGIGLVLVSSVVVVMLIYLLTMWSTTVAARRSVSALFRGQLGWLFLGGAIVAGLLVPTGLYMYSYLGEAQSAVLAVAGVLTVVGSFLIRYCLLKAGAFRPVVEISGI